MTNQQVEDYAVIGDLRTAALVGRDGSIDWLSLPRFDAPAVFAALLGDERNGRWVLVPANRQLCTRRRYRKDSLVLESEWTTADVDTIQRDLTQDGLVRRYAVSNDGPNVDDVHGDEGLFLACSFWLTEALHGVGLSAARAIGHPDQR
jgi:GH15 family glucan-1,4-alpha-glucosidase